MLSKRPWGWRDIQHYRGVRLVVQFVPDDRAYWAFSFDLMRDAELIAQTIAKDFVQAWDQLMTLTAESGVWENR